MFKKFLFKFALVALLAASTSHVSATDKADFDELFECTSSSSVPVNVQISYLRDFTEQEKENLHDLLSRAISSAEVPMIAIMQVIPELMATYKKYSFGTVKGVKIPFTCYLNLK